MRTVDSRLVLKVETPASIVLAVAVSSLAALRHETLSVTLDGIPVPTVEVAGEHGNRLHLLDCGPGQLTVSYAAGVGELQASVASPADRLTYLRPSRYCDSDRLAHVARAMFAGRDGSVPAPDLALAQQVRRWALSELRYAPGTTDHIDGATEIFLSRQGVCRDTAHLLIAFCRALGIPARLVACYAPGLRPMDFHAVAEVWVDGTWYVLDGTGLANRHGLVRIATGRDAADTAFLETLSGVASLVEMSVNATSADLPYDDGDVAVVLS